MYDTCVSYGMYVCNIRAELLYFDKRSVEIKENILFFSCLSLIRWHTFALNSTSLCERDLPIWSWRKSRGSRIMTELDIVIWRNSITGVSCILHDSYSFNRIIALPMRRVACLRQNGPVEYHHLSIHRTTHSTRSYFDAKLDKKKIRTVQRERRTCLSYPAAKEKFLNRRILLLLIWY